MNKNLIEKNEIIEGVDIDKYLETILKEYESFVNQRYDEFNDFREKVQESLAGKLCWSYFPIQRGEEEIRNGQIELIKRTERKIIKKQKEIEREKDEKRKSLILAILKIRGF
ncbi:hypothetical protein ES705_05669 [subsurface metagenome]